MRTLFALPGLALLALLALPAPPATATPPLPDSVTIQLAVSAGAAGGQGHSEVVGTLYDEIVDDYECVPGGPSNTAFASGESEELYGTIVAPNHIEGLGAATVQADATNGGGPFCGTANSASANVLFEFFVGLDGPGGVLVPVDVTIRGEHVANSTGFAGADVCLLDGAICVDTMGERTDMAPHGNAAAGAFDVTETLMMDPDTDLLEVTLRASASTFVGSGQSASSYAFADPDFIVSPGFANRNAYRFVFVPEAGFGETLAAGCLLLAALARRRRHRLP